MDKTHCNIIQDLLPLYADEIVSPQSRELVERHLADCPRCRETLAEIQSSIPIPQLDDDRVLKKMRRKQRIRSLCWALFAAVWVALILAYPVAALWVSFAEQPLTDYGPEHFIVTEYPDGHTELTLTEDARGAYVYYLYELNEDGTTDLYLYIYGQDPGPAWFRALATGQPFAEDPYATYDIGPEYNFESGSKHSNYMGVSAFRLDGTIVNVYYQPITASEQREFYYNYLCAGYLSGYQVPERSDCVCIWSAD